MRMWKCVRKVIEYKQSRDDKYDGQVSSGNTGLAQRSADREVMASEAQSQHMMDLTKKWGKWEQGTESAGAKK